MVKILVGLKQIPYTFQINAVLEQGEIRDTPTLTHFCYFFYFSQFMLMGAKLFWQKSISLLFSDRILGYLNTNTVCLSIQIVGSFLVSYCHWGVSEFTQSNVIKNDQETFSKLTSSASPIKKLYLGRAFVT